MENLRYGASLPLSTTLKIKHFVANTLQQDIAAYDIARTDLNGDGLDEFIARAEGCAPEDLCEYLILGETGETMLNLGEIKALRIMLGHDYTAGVRNLLVFDNAANDFDYQLYVWHSAQSRYAEGAP